MICVLTLWHVFNCFIIKVLVFKRPLNEYTFYNFENHLILFSATGSVFVVTLLFPTLITVLHPHGTYWLFSGVCFLTCGLYITLMPETKGLSILQIRELFRNKQRPGDQEDID